MKIENMNVLLTGATGGIGRSIARQLVAHGASVLLTSHLRDDLEDLQAELRIIAPSPEKVKIFTANLLDVDGLKSLIKAAKNTHFPINVVINNAGMLQFGWYENQSPAHIKQLIDLNTTVPMLLIHQLLPHLKDQPEAQILNVGSTFGCIGFPGFASYAASKAAMQGFSEALKRELNDTFVQVKYLSPRATQTDLNPKAVVEMNKELKVTMDDPDVVAGAAIKMLGGSKSCMVIGWPEKLFVKVNKLFPALVDKAIANQLPTIKRFAMQHQ